MEMTEQEKRKVKVKKYSGKILTIYVKEQTEDYISGIDRDGLFVKIPLEEIESCEPVREVRE